MAILRVNPTRMELTGLKKRLKIARKGHKLLKDKRDELMKQFLAKIHETMELRRIVEKEPTDTFNNFIIAGAVMLPEALDQALMYPTEKVSAQISTKSLMSVEVPVITIKKETFDAGSIYPYGFANTSAQLDSSIEKMGDVLVKMLQLSALEKTIHLLAAEIEKTRRRVNALEYVLIPNLADTVKYITMKLDENERGNLTRLMKVKDMMLKEAIRQKSREN